MREAIAAFVLGVAACGAADSPAQTLFNRLRSNVLADLARVPRYTCVETIERREIRHQFSRMPNSCPALAAIRDKNAADGVVIWRDRLRLDVAVGEKSEMFSFAGANRFDSESIEGLALSGATSSGDFGTFLASVFGADAEQFRYVGEKEIPLGTYAAYEYTVPVGKSHYSYKNGRGGGGVIGYYGTFFAAPGPALLRRLVVEADRFPTGEICRMRDTLDYTRLKVGSGDFLIPEVSTMEILHRDGEETRNETHYSNCHEFTGESTIRFDDPDEAADPKSAANAAKAALRALPSKTRVTVKIDPPVNSDTAAAGDPITGVVEHEVRQKGQVVFRTTDRLQGRLLQLEQAMLPQPRWTVAIRFDSVSRDGVEEPVTFRPVDDGDRTPEPPRMMGRRMQPMPGRTVPVTSRPPGAGVFLFTQAGRLALDAKFHSQWEVK